MTAQLKINAVASLSIPDLLRLVAEQLQAQTTLIVPSTMPRIGTVWPGQGGVFAGIMRGEGGNPDRVLIVPTDPSASFLNAAIGTRGTDVPNASSVYHGMGNTVALAAAGSDLCRRILDLRIEGHADWYLAARHELRLAWLNVPELFPKEWHWSSTQYSAGNAFVQGFGGGNQGLADKDGHDCARAVRSFVLQ